MPSVVALVLITLAMVHTLKTLQPPFGEAISKDIEMAHVKVLKNHAYGGERREVGDTYEMADKFLRAMVGIGRVEVATKKKRAYKRKDMKAEDE